MLNENVEFLSALRKAGGSSKERIDGWVNSSVPFCPDANEADKRVRSRIEKKFFANIKVGFSLRLNDLVFQLKRQNSEYTDKIV